jgi:hypothetical protein
MNQYDSEVDEADDDTLGETLQRGQRLPSVPLLDANVDVILLRTDVFAISERVSLICERVCQERKQCQLNSRTDKV